MALSITLTRVLKFSLQNFWRNIWLSIVTIIILFLTLFSITLSVSLNFVAQQAITAVKGRVAVNVYFLQNALEEDIRHVEEKLRVLPEVRDVEYVSREDALQAFRDRTSNNPIIQETLDSLGDNPLGATLVIKARNINDYPAIVDSLQTPEDQKVIEDVDFEESEQVITRLSSITGRLKSIGIIVSAVFSVIAALVIFNTIRITIYSYREEIGIMKLVGASNWFVRGPFILESIFYALVASVLCMFVLFVLVGASAPFFNSFFAGYDFDVVSFLQNNILAVFGLQLIVAMLLAIVSSTIAVGRYLRV